MDFHICRCLVMGVAVLAASGFAKEYRLASGGRTAFRIVLPEDAIPAEKTAARELQEHLKAMTGADFPLVSLAEMADGPTIAVGFNPKLPERLSPANFPNLGPEEFVIDSDGDVILLAGGRPRGALYATYEFLERFGIRWLTPEETIIPSRPELAVEVEPERYTSPFRSRTNVIGNNPTPQWSARNRMNSFIEWSNPGEEYGGGVQQGPDMDNMWRYVNPAVFHDHPEWAAFVDGKRQIETGGTHNWGTCLSNVEFRRFAVACAMDWLRAHPNSTDVWLTSNDGSPHCTCPECQAFYDAHGGKTSATQMQLVNEFAAAVAKEFPNVRVKTLAYSWSRMPPDNMTMADNVTIMVCATGMGFFSEFGPDEDSKPFLEDVAKWKAICSDLEVYLYSHPYDDFWFPAPCLYNQARNIRRIKDLGFKLVHQEDFGKMGLVGGEQCALRSWLFTRMAWRPDSDVEALIQDFCRSYYGPAADDVLYAIHRTEERHANGWRPSPSDGNISLMVPYYVDAEAVEDIRNRLLPVYESQTDPVIQKRVGYILLPYLWADYWLGLKGIGAIQPDEGRWGATMEDRDRREKEAYLIRKLMVENGINAIQESGKFNPANLPLPELARSYDYIQLKDGDVQATLVPGLMGKLTELSRGGRNVIKAMFGCVRTQYPQYGYVRDFVNGHLPAEYTVVEQGENRVVMEANVDNALARKTFELNGKALSYTVELRRDTKGGLQISHVPLLNLDSDVLGIYPKLYIQFPDGWRLMELGKAGTFWYQDGPIDIKGFTGRLVLVAESGDCALELTLRSEEVDSLSYEYDRYEFKPEGSSHIFLPMFRTPSVEVEQQGTLRLQVVYRPLLPAEFPDFTAK